MFTWCNNQLGLARRQARLDHSLVNTSWLDRFSFYTLNHLSRLFSDHAPLLLNVSSHIGNAHKVFRFENYWLDYIGCHEAVKAAWSCSPNGNPMHVFSHFISRTRYNIISWNRTSLSPLDSDIKNTEAAIVTLETADISGFEVFNDLSGLYSKFASLQRQNFLLWAQLAHLLWVEDGDRNTAFFHNLVHFRSHFNFISQITNLDGSSVCEKSDIENAFIQYYSNLWTTPCDNSYLCIISSSLGGLPTIYDVYGRFLTREVTREEIYHIVLDLSSGKSPGPDGYNAEFYKFFQDDIGDHLVSAIKHFFTNFILPNSWGKTYIALIP